MIDPDDYVCCLYANAEDERVCVRDRCLFNLGTFKGYYSCLLFSLIICFITVALAFYIFKTL